MNRKLWNQFKERVLNLSGEVFYAEDKKEVGELISRLISQYPNPMVGVAVSPLIEESGVVELVEKSGGIIDRISGGEPVREFKIGISEMDLGIAQTGSLVQDATDLGKRLVSMLPEIHIALLRGENIVPCLQDALDHFYRKGIPPGYIAFISGPSRTADIERVLTIGVHGPERLVVIVLNERGEGTKRGKKRV
ncbi:MAG: lactate utilization protein [Desulfitobacteriaceae bacterium]|nr:lactate utilization protein [Desulfitobacteriaceae bacterium]